MARWTAESQAAVGDAISRTRREASLIALARTVTVLPGLGSLGMEPVKKMNVEGAPENAKIPAAREAVKQTSIQDGSTAVMVKTAEMKRKEFFLAVKKQVQADKVKMSIAAEQRQEEEERKKASPAELSEACIGASEEVEELEVFRAARFMTAMREHKIKVAIEAGRLRLEAKYGILAGRTRPNGKCSRFEDKFQDDSDSCDSSEGGSSGYEGSQCLRESDSRSSLGRLRISRHAINTDFVPAGLVLFLLC
jgi:hypothetical protein